MRSSRTTRSAAVLWIDSPKLKPACCNLAYKPVVNLTTDRVQRGVIKRETQHFLQIPLTQLVDRSGSAYMREINPTRSLQIPSGFGGKGE
jgi:hypothetical protein